MKNGEDEMLTIEEYIELEKSFNNYCIATDCNKCKIEKQCNKMPKYTIADKIQHLDAWKKANTKTYKDDFLEKHPKAMLTDAGRPKSCRKHIYGEYNCSGIYCVKCWNEPYEE